MSQKSKIAQLPAYTREHLALLIETGATEKECADYLNDEIRRLAPDFDHVVKEAPVSQQNVHNWKVTEYEARKAAAEITKGLAQALTRGERQNRLDEILSWLTAKLAAEVLLIEKDPPPPDQYTKRLHEIVADISTLRRLDHENEWIDAEKRRVKVGEARFNMTLKLNTHKLAKEKHDREETEQQLQAKNAYFKKYLNHVERKFDRLIEKEDAEAALGHEDIEHNGVTYTWSKEVRAYMPKEVTEEIDDEYELSEDENDEHNGEPGENADPETEKQEKDAPEHGNQHTGAVVAVPMQPESGWRYLLHCRAHGHWRRLSWEYRNRRPRI